MNFLDLESTFIDRLTLCHREITGIKRVDKTPPAQVIDNADLPAVYHLIGPMTGDDVPASGDDMGAVTIARRYIARLLVHPALMGGDIYQSGAEANIKALPFFALFRNYYLQHPRLSTSTLQELGLAQDIKFRDSGLVIRPGPGGANYHVIDFTLTIAARIFVDVGLS